MIDADLCFAAPLHGMFTQNDAVRLTIDDAAHEAKRDSDLTTTTPITNETRASAERTPRQALQRLLDSTEDAGACWQADITLLPMARRERRQWCSLRAVRKPACFITTQARTRCVWGAFMAQMSHFQIFSAVANVLLATMHETIADMVVNHRTCGTAFKH